MEVSRWFVRNEERRQRLEGQLSADCLGFFLNEVGFYAAMAGEPETALPHYSAAEAIDRREAQTENLAQGLRNLADIETALGRLGEAFHHITEAVELAAHANNDRMMCACQAFRALATSLRGDTDTATRAYAEANSIENRIHGKGVCGIRGIYWAEHLLRIGQTSRAREVTTRNREICVQYSWKNDVARCEWMLGWLDVVEGQWLSAHDLLDRQRRPSPAVT